jgi:hypothetical protein
VTFRPTIDLSNHRFLWRLARERASEDPVKNAPSNTSRADRSAPLSKTADLDDLAAALTFALKFEDRKRWHDADLLRCAVAPAAFLGARSVNNPRASMSRRSFCSGGRRPGEAGMAMPAFGNAYSDAEIAAAPNYVTAQFGAAGPRLRRRMLPSFGSQVPRDEVRAAADA